VTELEVDFKLYLAWRTSTNFILGHGLPYIRQVMAGAQYLEDLDEVDNPDKKQIIQINKGVIYTATAGLDYIYTQEQQDESYISLIEAKPVGDVDDNKKLISRSSIRVVQGLGVDVDNNKNFDDIFDINSLHLKALQAKEVVSSDKDVIAGVAVKTKELVLFDETSANTKSVNLKSRETLLENKSWNLPVTGNNNDIIVLENNSEWNFKNPADVSADRNATYILQKPNDKLPHSQALSLLNGGILKTTLLSDGTVSIASGGKLLTDDYVKPADLLEEIAVVEEEIVALETQLLAITEAIETATGIAITYGIIDQIENLLGWVGYQQAFDAFVKKSALAESVTTKSLKVTEKLTIPIYAKNAVPDMAVGSAWIELD
jgi:hypothetical protein